MNKKLTFNLFILSQETDVREFQSTTVCVRGEICFKEIVSNTRPDLNHLSFTHLVCELLIIYRFPFIDVRTRFGADRNSVGFARKKAQTTSLVERGFERLGLGRQTVGFT